MSRTEHPRVWIAILFVACVCALGLRSWGVSQKRGYSHDGMISFLAATGNQQRWADRQEDLAPPFAEWTSAGEWLDEMLSIHEGTSLRQIAIDLTHNDTHPPLYFWMLHYAVAAFGVHPWTGAVLNLPLSLLTLLALFGLGVTCGLQRRTAALVALVWGISPASVTMDWENRHYGLFALMTVLFVWLVVRAIDGERVRLSLAGLAVVTGAGLLTHYFFSVVILSAALAVLILQAADWRRLASIAGALLAGAMILLVAHPGFWRSLVSGGGMADEVAKGGVLRRLFVIGWTTGEFITVSRRLAAVGFWATVLALVLAVALSPRARRWFVRVFEEASQTLRVTLTTTVLLVLLTWGFLWYLSPSPANSARYLGPAWPLFALLIVYLLSRINSRSWSAVAIGLPVLLVLMTAWAVHRHPFGPMISPETLAGAERVVVDTPLRGSVLRTVIHAPADQLFFVATQQRLLARPEHWLLDVGSGDLLISEQATGNTLERRRELAGLLGERYGDVRALGPPDAYTRIYRVDGK